MQTPWTTRSANQSVTSVLSWNSSEATAAVAAKAANARMWPTVRITRAPITQPITKPPA